MTISATIYIVSYVGDHEPLGATWTEEEARKKILRYAETRPQTIIEDYQITPVFLDSFITYINEKLNELGIQISGNPAANWANRALYPLTPGELFLQSYLGFDSVFDPMASAIDVLQNPERLKMLGIPMTQNGEVLVRDRLEDLVEYFNGRTYELKPCYK